MADPGSTIVRVDAQPVELALHEPFGISGGSRDTAHIAVVRLELADGSVGLGEAAPLPAYNGEDVHAALACVAAAAPAWVGRDARAWRRRAGELPPCVRASASARCALETALLDALARRAGLSLYHWFGGHGPASLESDVTIPIVEPEAARDAAARWWERGFRRLKIKVGSARDRERVLAAHAGAPGARFVLDANAGLTANEACRLIAALESAGVVIDLFEQPVAAGDWSGLEQVARRARVALDESATSARDVLRAARHLGAPHVINVKLMKSGVVEALDMVAVARATGLSLMIGGMLESGLAMSTSACFAAGLGGFEFVDLDTPLFLAESPFGGGFEWRGASLDLTPIDAGHGVTRLVVHGEPER